MSAVEEMPRKALVVAWDTITIQVVWRIIPGVVIQKRAVS